MSVTQNINKELEKHSRETLATNSASKTDVSLIEHTLKLSYEERIAAHESARQLVNDLRKAGQEYYARRSKTTP